MVKEGREVVSHIIKKYCAGFFIIFSSEAANTYLYYVKYARVPIILISTIKRYLVESLYCTVRDDASVQYSTAPVQYGTKADITISHTIQKIS